MNSDSTFFFVGKLYTIYPQVEWKGEIWCFFSSADPKIPILVQHLGKKYLWNHLSVGTVDLHAYLQLLTDESLNSLRDVSKCSMEPLLFAVLDSYIQPEYVKQFGDFCLRWKHEGPR